jgi:hypothetical protein
MRRFTLHSLQAVITFFAPKLNNKSHYIIKKNQNQNQCNYRSSKMKEYLELLAYNNGRNHRYY